jgi:hypothetical protein
VTNSKTASHACKPIVRLILNSMLAYASVKLESVTHTNCILV